MAAPLARPHSRPWYREPLVWMLIGIPASAVVMGAIAVWLSIATDDGLVVDDYYRRGLQINRALERDAAATGHALAARLRLDAGGTRLLLESGRARFRPPATLQLRLSHATRPGLDRRVELLMLVPGDYTGAALALAPGRWYVEVSADDWRLTGALQAPGATRVQLSARRPP